MIISNCFYFGSQISSYDASPTDLCGDCIEFITSVDQFYNHAQTVQLMFNELVQNSLQMIETDTEAIRAKYQICSINVSAVDTPALSAPKIETLPPEYKPVTMNDPTLTTILPPPPPPSRRSVRKKKEPTSITTLPAPCDVIKPEVKLITTPPQLKLVPTPKVEKTTFIFPSTGNYTVESYQGEDENDDDKTELLESEEQMVEEIVGLMNNSQLSSHQFVINVTECRAAEKKVDSKDGKQRYVCNECDKSYTRRQSLKEHLKLKHCKRPEGIDYPFKCDSCPKKFPLEKKLRLHKFVHLPPEKKTLFPCPYCDKK